MTCKIFILLRCRYTVKQKYNKVIKAFKSVLHVCLCTHLGWRVYIYSTAHVIVYQLSQAECMWAFRVCSWPGGTYASRMHVRRLQACTRICVPTLLWLCHPRCLSSLLLPNKRELTTNWSGRQGKCSPQVFTRPLRGTQRYFYVGPAILQNLTQM